MQRAKKQKELKNLFRRDCGIERLPNKPQDSDGVLREQEAALLASGSSQLTL